MNSRSALLSATLRDVFALLLFASLFVAFALPALAFVFPSPPQPDSATTTAASVTAKIRTLLIEFSLLNLLKRHQLVLVIGYLSWRRLTFKPHPRLKASLRVLAHAS